MKKLSKFVALLLAGAMAMLLLTACGGSIPGENTQAEKNYLNAANAQRGVGMQSLDNDQKLKERANKLLDTAVDVSTGQFTGKAKVDIGTEDGKLVVTAVSKCTYDNEKVNEFLNSIKFDNQNVNVNFAGLWTDVGVVVKTIKGQTYIAVSVKLG